MTLGVQVQQLAAAPAAAAVSDTGTLFLACKPGAGPTNAAVLCKSLNDFVASYGARVTANAAAYDYLDAYFQEGGGQAYVGGYVSDYDNALALFDSRLGPGQLAVIGSAYTPTQTILEDCATVAMNANRVFIGDVLATDLTATALEAYVAALPVDVSAEYMGLFGSWVTIPGPLGVAGVGPRSVPASAIISALCNRVDNDGNPGRAAAGTDYALQYATGFAFDPSMSVRQAILADGVNTFATLYNVLENYGFNTPVAPSVNTPFWQLNASRARMWLTAKAAVIGEQYMFKNVDAGGRLAAQLQKDLMALCLELYNAGGLYGDTPQDAYDVQVNGEINTTADAAAGQLNAIMQGRFALAAQSVTIDLVSVPVTGNVT